MKNLVTQAQFARDVGVSRQYVSGMVKKGVIRLKSGKVDPVQAKSALSAFREHAKASKLDAISPVAMKKEDLAKLSLQELTELRDKLKAGTPHLEEATVFSEELLQARVQSEQLKARLLALKVAKEEGELVDAQQVQLDFANVGAIIQQKMRSIPSRIADQVLACKTSAEVRAVLGKEIDIALTALADGLSRGDEED